MGAWIEIEKEMRQIADALVAPFVGAWIEIEKATSDDCVVLVAPFVGAWIEISMDNQHIFPAYRRSLRGSVD